MLLIIGHCICELIGVYDNCLCLSSYLGRRSGAYISFIDFDSMTALARPYWAIGGIVTMVIIIIASILLSVGIGDLKK
jgi:hypothetical protein